MLPVFVHPHRLNILILHYPIHAIAPALNLDVSVPLNALLSWKYLDFDRSLSKQSPAVRATDVSVGGGSH